MYSFPPEALLSCEERLHPCRQNHPANRRSARESAEYGNKEEKLLCVAVTDIISNGLSAVYTFYHPDYKANGLGIFSILTQLSVCKQMALPYLYLGYQIDDCQKMNYKNRYFPFERFIDGEWQLNTKPVAKKCKIAK